MSGAPLTQLPLRLTLPPFMFYALYYGALAALAPFVALYYQSLGLSGAQIGLLTGLSPLVSLIGGPLWTGFADATHRHKLILSLTIAGTAALALCIPAVRAFGPLLPLVLFFSFITAPIIAFADSATMGMLAEQRALYGRVRVGGTLGWGLAAPLIGLAIERNGLLWSFWIFAGGMALTLVVAQWLVFERVEKQAAFYNGLRALLSNPRWLIFLGMVFISGIGFASVNTYLFIYMAEVGISKSLMGLALTLSTLSELPVMFYGNVLLKRLKPLGLVSLAMGVIGVRLLLQAMFNAPGALLFIQLVHGLTFPAILVAGVAFAHEHAPPGLSATAQGLFGAVMMGLGGAAGNFFGGLLIDRFGVRGMFAMFGVVVLMGLALFALLERRLPRSEAPQ